MAITVNGTTLANGDPFKVGGVQVQSCTVNGVEVWVNTQAPSTILNFSATETGGGQITFTWGNATGIPTPKYNVERLEDGTQWVNVASGYVLDTWRAIGTYRVQAINSAGSANSNLSVGRGTIFNLIPDCYDWLPLDENFTSENLLNPYQNNSVLAPANTDNGCHVVSGGANKLTLNANFIQQQQSTKTFSFSFKAPDFPDTGYIVGNRRDDASSGVNDGFHLGVSGGKMTCKFVYGGNTLYAEGVTANSLVPNEFNSVIITYSSGARSEVVVYLNGVKSIFPCVLTSGSYVWLMQGAEIRMSFLINDFFIDNIRTVNRFITSDAELLLLMNEGDKQHTLESNIFTPSSNVSKGFKGGDFKIGGHFDAVGLVLEDRLGGTLTVPFNRTTGVFTTGTYTSSSGDVLYSQRVIVQVLANTSKLTYSARDFSSWANAITTIDFTNTANQMYISGNSTSEFAGFVTDGLSNNRFRTATIGSGISQEGGDLIIFN